MVIRLFKSNYKSCVLIICSFIALALLTFDKEIRYAGLVILGLVLYIVGLIYISTIIKRKSLDFVLQISPFVIVPWLLWNEYTFYTREHISNLWACLTGLAVFNLCFLSLFAICIKKSLTEYSWRKTSKWIYNNWEILLLVVLIILLSLDTINAWMTNDGVIYTIGIMNARNKWNYLNFDALNLGAHRGYSYGIMALIADLWFPGQVIGVKILNIILATITIFAFHGIIKLVFPKINRYLKVLFVSFFAFSPMLFGMLGDINLEYPQLCFLTWLVYSHLAEKKILRCFSGVCLCFAKETGFVLYVAYSIGMFFGYLLRKKDMSLFRRIKYVVLQEMPVELFNGILWIYTFVGFNSTIWGVSSKESLQGLITTQETLSTLNSFDLWPSYIFYKVKEVLLINLGWIFWMVIVGLSLIFVRRFFQSLKESKLDFILAFLFSGIAFICIQFFYVTWTNYRYLSPITFYQVFILCFVIYSTLTYKLSRELLSLCLSAIILVTNFYTLGPIFDRFIERDFGNGKMIIPNLFALEYVELDTLGNYVITRTLTPEFDRKTGTRDCMEYNRQYSYFGMAFEEFLEEIDYTEDDLIVIPNVLENEEFMSHSLFYRDTDIMNNNIFWNDKAKHLNMNTYISEDKSDNRTNEKLNIVYVNAGEHISHKLNKKYSRIFYIEADLGQEFNHRFYTDKSLEKIGQIEKNVYSYPVYQLK